MNRTKVILSIFLMLFLLLAGLVLPSFWKSQKKEGRIYIIYRFSLPIIYSLFER